jgi:hypothetical protein
VIVLVLAGCTPRPELLAGPTLTEPVDTPLTRVLQVTTDRPTRLRVHLTGPGVDVDVSWPELRTDHEVPLLGAKPDRVHEVVVELTPTDGRLVTATARFRTEPLPDDFPAHEVLTLAPDRVAPGYRLLTLDSNDRGPFLAAVDAWDGEVAWLYTGPENFGDVKRTPRGTFLGLGQGVLELDPTGVLLRRWNDTGDLTDPAWISVGFGAEHHEVTEVGPDEFAVLTLRRLAVDAYPWSYTDPTFGLAATLQDAGIVRFRADGTELSTWWYSDVLDPFRIGFHSLDVVGGARDWVHGNALIRRPDGGWLASSRHQDALFALDDEGQLEWILASPSGWGEAWAPHLLAPDAGTTWPYHQHGPSFGVDGELVVFDNHNEGHNPYEPAPDALPESRVLAYDVDGDAGTVSQRWEWRHPDHLYSGALGNATALPGGTVVACYGFLDDEGGAPNRDRGLGRKVTRVVELDPDAVDPVSDLRFWYPAERAREGVKSYRAVPTDSLYPDDVTVVRQRAD